MRICPQSRSSFSLHSARNHSAHWALVVIEMRGQAYLQNLGANRSLKFTVALKRHFEISIFRHFRFDISTFLYFDFFCFDISIFRLFRPHLKDGRMNLLPPSEHLSWLKELKNNPTEFRYKSPLHLLTLLGLSDSRRDTRHSVQFIY